MTELEESLLTFQLQTFVFCTENQITYKLEQNYRNRSLPAWLAELSSPCQQTLCPREVEHETERERVGSLSTVLV